MSLQGRRVIQEYVWKLLSRITASSLQVTPELLRMWYSLIGTQVDATLRLANAQSQQISPHNVVAQLKIILYSTTSMSHLPT